MRQKASRSFSLFDAMILLAATAFGMAGSRTILFLGGWLDLDRPTGGWTVVSALNALARAVWLSQSFLAAWAIGLLALTLRRSRPRLRQLFLQPGFVVCIATVLGMIKGTLELLARWLLFSITKDEDWWLINTHVVNNPWVSVPLGAWFRIHDYLINESEYIGFGIVLAWIILAISGRCRTQRTWLNRIGMILGVLWIVAAVGSWYIDEALALDLFASGPAPMPAQP